MAALKALQRTPGALLRNPVLVVPILFIGLFQGPQIVLQSIDPFLASIASFAISGLFILVMPFLQGGIIGMADEALGGHTSLGTFLSVGKANYVNVLVAYLLVLSINMALGVILLIVAAVGGFLVLSEVTLSGFALGFLGLFFVLFVLGFLLLVFFLQFYAQAIVLDDESAIDGIKKSYQLVRSNLLSTFGYSIIGGAIGGVLGLVLGGLSMLTAPASAQAFDLPELSLVVIIALVLIIIVLGSIIGSFLAIFSVAFYREISRTG